MSSKVIKVSALVRYLKGKMDSDQNIQNLLISGEISNLTRHRSGHWYFTIKDALSRMNCVMFSSYVQRNKINLNNGDQVILRANTSVFEGSGQLQLYVTAIQLDGRGDLHQQFEDLKKKLFELGYFDESLKKEIPKYPMTIGLVTGKSTAAREDVLSTLSRRWPLAKVMEVNTLVQGDQAANQMISALNSLDTKELDVLLLVRGGGSIEDLWAFNKEDLAICILNLKTPLITGVGHEVDVTIADYVADLRAPTPTGAAEMATPDMTEVLTEISGMRQSLIRMCSQRMELAHYQVDRIFQSSIFVNPDQLFQQKLLLVDYKRNQLLQAIHQTQEKKAKATQKLSIFTNYLNDVVQSTRSKLNMSEIELNSRVKEKVTQQRHRIGRSLDLLEAYSPIKVLKRGYSLSYSKDTVLTSINQIEEGNEICIQVSDGTILTKVLEKRKNYGKKENI